MTTPTKVSKALAAFRAPYGSPHFWRGLWPFLVGGILTTGVFTAVADAATSAGSGMFTGAWVLFALSARWVYLVFSQANTSQFFGAGCSVMMFLPFISMALPNNGAILDSGHYVETGEAYSRDDDDGHTHTRYYPQDIRLSLCPSNRSQASKNTPDVAQYASCSYTWESLYFTHGGYPPPEASRLSLFRFVSLSEYHPDNKTLGWFLRPLLAVQLVAGHWVESLLLFLSRFSLLAMAAYILMMVYDPHFTRRQQP